MYYRYFSFKYYDTLILTHILTLMKLFLQIYSGAVRSSDFIFFEWWVMSHFFINVKICIMRNFSRYRTSVLLYDVWRGKGDRLVFDEKVYIRFRTVNDW